MVLLAQTSLPQLMYSTENEPAPFVPLCRALGKGLWEVRSDLTGGRIARVLFCIHDGKMVLLHAFIKKTQ